MACSEVAAFLQTAGAHHISNVFQPMSLQVSVFNENNGRVAFIGIVIHNHFVLPMSLFIGLTFRFPNREASSEQFSTQLPLQLQKDT